MDRLDSKCRSCNFCGSGGRQPLYKINGYHIVKCERCGLCYVAEQISCEVLIDYYGDTYYNGKCGQGYVDYLGHRDTRKAHFRSLLSSIHCYLFSKDVRVLDVGCAAGFFLEVAQEAGWRAQGIELSPYMSEYARRSLGLDVITGTLEEASLPEASFDLVTMWDVIEHLPNPYQALKHAHRLLVPGGMIAITTGDIAGATARIYGRRWALLAPPGHLFYFSRQTLFMMLQHAGFELLNWQSDGAFLINDKAAENKTRPIWSKIYALHQNRFISALLRRLKLGSIMTVYARRRSSTASRELVST